MGKLLSFTGRASRARWWVVNLLTTIVYLVAVGAAGAGAAMSSDPEQALESMGLVSGAAIFVLTIMLAWISLAVGAQRWHDRNKSAWWLLIMFVPAIGSLWFLIECGFLKGTTGSNRFGNDQTTVG